MGIEGSEALRLPVLRAQLGWMEAVLAVWRGDVAEAKRHHRIAAVVHEQTELYGAGGGLMATPDTGREDMVDLVRMALLTVSDGPEIALAAQDVLAGWLADRERPHVWTALGHLVLLAHLAADCELVRGTGPRGLGTVRRPGRHHRADRGRGRYAAIGAVHCDPVDPMPTHEYHALLRELTTAGPGSNSPQTIVELRLLGGALRASRGTAARSAAATRRTRYR